MATENTSSNQSLNASSFLTVSGSSPVHFSIPIGELGAKGGALFQVVVGNVPQSGFDMAISVVGETESLAFIAVSSPIHSADPGHTEAITAMPLETGYAAKGWELLSSLTIQIRTTSDRVIVETWLESLFEYGTGSSNEEAIADLVVSIGEYLELLEARQPELGDIALKEFAHLRRLVTRSVKKT